MKVAIIHVGSHKTGSTSIQKSLALSKQNLNKHSIDYFNDYASKTQLLSVKFRNRVGGKQFLNSNDASWEAVQKNSLKSWATLSERVKNGHTYTIISEEFLLRLQDTDALYRTLKKIFDKIIIVAYIRSPTSWLPSSVDQRIRAGQTVDEIALGGRALPRLLGKLDRYCRTFGMENMIVRHFDTKNMFGCGPVTDFAHIISNVIGANINLEDPGQANSGLPAGVVAYFMNENQDRCVQKIERDQAWFNRRNTLISAIRKDRDLMSGNKLKLNNKILIGHLWNVFSEEINEINSRYLTNQLVIDIGEIGMKLSVPSLACTLSEWIISHDNMLVNYRLDQLRRKLFE